MGIGIISGALTESLPDGCALISERVPFMALVVQKDLLTTLNGWEGLASADRQTVYSETQALGKALVEHGISKLTIGEHLSRLRDVLEPQRMFVQYLRTFHFSQRTAYRYMDGFENAKRMLPENVLRAAMTRGIDFFGRGSTEPLGSYTEVIKRLPPPKTSDEKKIHGYLDEIEASRRDRRKNSGEVLDAADPETMLRECFRYIDARYRRLPQGRRGRLAWVRSLFGLLLTQLGASGPQSFTPLEIPPGYQARRGRPPSKTHDAD